MELVYASSVTCLLRAWNPSLSFLPRAIRSWKSSSVYNSSLDSAGTGAVQPTHDLHRFDLLGAQVVGQMGFVVRTVLEVGVTAIAVDVATIVVPSTKPNMSL